MPARFLALVSRLLRTVDTHTPTFGIGIEVILQIVLYIDKTTFQTFVYLRLQWIPSNHSRTSACSASL
jgi:hypothetical protein